MGPACPSCAGWRGRRVAAAALLALPQRCKHPLPRDGTASFARSHPPAHPPAWRRANGEVFRPTLTGSEEGLTGGAGAGGQPALCVRLLRALGDIQYGRTPHPWGVVVE